MSHYFPDSVRVDTNKVKFDLTNYASKNYVYIHISISNVDVQQVKRYMKNISKL